MGLLVQSLYALSCLHAHCHPYTFLWFLALPSLHPSTYLENVFYTSVSPLDITMFSHVHLQNLTSKDGLRHYSIYFLKAGSVAASDDV